MNILKKLTSGFLALILLSGLMPAMAEEEREKLLAGWAKAVSRVGGWAK